MEIINEKYAYIDEATNAIASINNKINLSLLLEDLTKSHKNNKKRIMLKKISSNIAFHFKLNFISFVENNNTNHDISNLIYSFLNFKNVYEF